MLPRFLDRVRPGLVQYQAGMDPFEHDPVGGIEGVTAAFLGWRDGFVLSELAARITDNLSGLGYTWVYFIAPTGQLAYAGFGPPTSGDARDGRYEATMTFPQYSPGGIWHLYYVAAEDAVANRRYIFEAEAAAFGFPTELVVNAELPPPDALRSLSALVASYGLSNGVERSLTAKLQNAIAALEAANAGSRRDAANKIGAFINAVEAQRGKALTAAQADELTAKAQRILAALG